MVRDEGSLLGPVVGRTTVVVGVTVALLNGPLPPPLEVPLEVAVVTGAGGAGVVVVVFVMLIAGGGWTTAMLEPQVLTWKFWNSGWVSGGGLGRGGWQRAYGSVQRSSI